ncbi:hypothetical protein PCANC_14257 [Puccinia coronata f. sp. avenae]|uniref:Integrase catalytic domain-containing protein n=1 Tax=Puccinia coronata f. sp. avenae TaxID=200324 RepID=A0A2N5SRL9_9BASI|nr:hypothetical protein PCANC_14257 [Puccinia coronata f. sp. avenae]
MSRPDVLKNIHICRRNVKPAVKIRINRIRHKMPVHASVFVTFTSSEEKKALIVDSAASHHMIHNCSLFSKLNAKKIVIKTEYPHDVLYAEGVGSVSVVINGNRMELEDCLYFPNILQQLISLVRLINKSITIKKDKDSFSIFDNTSLLFAGYIIDNLLHVPCSISPKALISKKDSTTPTIWHQRPGHPNDQVMKTMNLPILSDHGLCEVCTCSKMTSLPFKHHFSNVHHPLQRIHMDLVGPIVPSSVSGFKYFLTIVDQYSSFKIECKIKEVVSDNGGEFISHQFKNFTGDCGILHTFSPPETPKHNGYAEQANRTILDKARGLLLTSNLPKSYWAEAINMHAVFDETSFPHLRQSESPQDLALKLEDFFFQEVSSTVVLDLILCAQIPIIIPSNSTSVVIPSETTVAPTPPLKTISSNILSSNILPYKRQPKARVYATAVSSIPAHYNEAINGSELFEWTAAIKAELNAMAALKVWDVVERLPAMKTVGTTWVFQKKDNQNANVVFKACLCAQGFLKTHGVDFSKTFTPTGPLNSLRSLISFAAANHLDFQQIDVKTAFLNADLEEEVFLSIPQGVHEDEMTKALKLNKSIYGLKQAPLAWYN